MTKTQHKDGLSVSVQINEHILLSDVKVASGGTDAGPDPHEILEAALGACTSITVQMYANRKAWDLKSCNTQVEITQEDKDAIIIQRKISFVGNLDDTQKQRLFEIAEKCPIHNLLMRGAQIKSVLI